ncbi:CoA transferase [Pseudonocardia nematodicida]|uniref:CoA transferase n=1 Tax=Pseudonocardia nematodicida TaxID=1206997 RepID=A0ABV1K7J4_9PSEU
MSDLPLSGVRVLELGNYIAAPTAGRLLADFGADVIKVERPGTGDELRSWRLYAGDTSMLYRTLNRSKRSITLDMKTDAGKQAVLDLTAASDVVLENFRPGTLEKWGLGPSELDAVNPDVVLVRISAFGQTGPLAGRPGFAAVAEAMGGLRALVGEEDRPPSRTGVSIGDSIAGLYGAFSAVMGLYQRGAVAGRVPLDRRSMDIALNEAVFSMMESLVPDHLAYGVERRRVGGRMEGIAPSNAYVCGDGGSVVIAGNGDSIYGRFMQVIGRPELASEPDLASNAGRWARRDELDGAIEEWTRSLPRDEALAQLEEAGVPAGPIHSAADIVADPQFAARDMVQFFDVDTGGDEPARVGFPGVVPVLDGRSVPVRHVGPDLGADTHDVLGGLLGYPAGKIAAAAGEETS